MKRCLIGLAAVVASLWLIVPLTTGTAHAAGTFNVLHYGAKGNGTTNDAAAFNAAIAAAHAAGGGTVLIPADKYLIGSSIHMMSNVTLDLAAGSTMLGTAEGYDPPESTPYGFLPGLRAQPLP